MIVVRTPHRVSLFGGGTDFPSWYMGRGGKVIGGAIDKYCYLTVRELPPFFEHRYRIVYSEIETVLSADDIRHPAARQAVLNTGIEAGLEIHHDSDLPARTGIGSSSAFVVGIIQGLAALHGSHLSASELARMAIHLEREDLGELGGHQDQVFCAYGGFRAIHFEPDGRIDVQDPLPTASELQQWLVLVYTGVKRNSSSISQAFVERLDRQDNDLFLTELAEVTDEAAAMLTSDRSLDLRAIGQLLDATWELKARMNPLAVPVEIEDLHKRARAAGALGGKVSGAGGGGFCVFVVDPEQQTDFIEKMQPCLVVPFAFSDKGSEIIFKDSQKPASSALNRKGQACQSATHRPL